MKIDWNREVFAGYSVRDFVVRLALTVGLALVGWVVLLLVALKTYH